MKSSQVKFMSILIVLCIASTIFFRFSHSTLKKATASTRPKILISTMLTDDFDKYYLGAEKLIKSIKTATGTDDVEFKILELDSRPVQDQAIRNALLRAGWSFLRLPRIPPRNDEKTHSRFRDQFTKLHYWNMTEYERVLYLDSDCAVVGNLDELLSMNITSKPLWATRDIRDGRWADTFNLGVFVIRPSSSEFLRLMRDKDDKLVVFEELMSEQGFLNAVYHGQWGEIGFRNNANLGVYTDDRQYWGKHEAGINVIHFTMSKPWECSSPYEAVCEMWKNGPKRA